MMIESVQQFQEKEAIIAALKIIALGEKDRLGNKGLTADESRAQLRDARQRRIMDIIMMPDAQDDLLSLQDFILDKWAENEWLKA